MRTLLAASLFLLLMISAGCGKVAAPVDALAGSSGTAAETVASTVDRAEKTTPDKSQGFASLPDRGDLVEYPGNVVRHRGAYTWYRADISEAHALHSIASGYLRLTAPDGGILDFKYDRKIEHASGDWTWVGHLSGHPGARAILTFGDQAAFGKIAQPGKSALKLTMHDGASWLVATDPDKLAAMGTAATRRQGQDYLMVPQAALRRSALQETTRPVTGLPTSARVAANLTMGGMPTVDVLVGYTAGFATAMGGASAAQTRLNHLVDIANIAYQDSQIAGRIRLVGAMQVDYTDTNGNDTALHELTGYDSGTQQQIPTDPAFDALLAAREELGADLVSLVRDFHTPENEGCGIAWLLGGSLGGVSGVQDSADFAFSVVSDGSDVDEGDAGNYYCLDETFAHELGHNMGAAHDKATSEGDDGVLDNPDDYGAFTYSFGYKAAVADGNFYTIMAYGDTNQGIVGVFSNPGIGTCAQHACGASDADNAKTLNNTFSAVAGFRGAVSPVANAYADFNGDGVSDLFWRDAGMGLNAIWLSANGSTQQSVASVRSLSWKVVGIGDFDADGQADVLWRNVANGANVIWRSGNSATVRQTRPVAKLDWKVAGIGDFDGDGSDDILWRNHASGANVIWKSALNTSPLTVTPVTNMNWVVAGVGDFDSDGKSDILWQNAKTGTNLIWKSGNSATVQLLTQITNLSWKIEGVGDFNGDGASDIFWRNAGAGKNTIWLSGNSKTQRAVSGLDASFKVGQIGDFTADGVADLVWRRSSTGSNLLWPSADSSLQQPLNAIADQNWQMQPQTD